MAEIPVMSGDVTFFFEKSNHFRVVHVDGAFGGTSPGNHLLHMAVYSERSPLPKSIVQKVEAGVLGAEIHREAKTGIFREVEVDLVMSIEVAAAIRDWIDQKIKEHAVVTAQIEAAGDK